MKKWIYWAVGAVVVIGGVWYFFGSKIKTSVASMFSK